MVRFHNLLNSEKGKLFQGKFDFFTNVRAILHSNFIFSVTDGISSNQLAKYKRTLITSHNNAELTYYQCVLVTPLFIQGLSCKRVAILTHCHNTS